MCKADDILIAKQVFNMLDTQAQVIREQITGKPVLTSSFQEHELTIGTANASLLFFLHRGSKNGYSDPIIAVMRNGRDTSASVVAIKGDREMMTIVEEVSAASDLEALQAVYERSKIDLSLAMNLAKEVGENEFGNVAGDGEMSSGSMGV